MKTHWHTPFRTERAAGTSLVALLVGVVVSGIVAFGVSDLLLSSKNLDRRSQIGEDAIDVRDYVSDAIRCNMSQDEIRRLPCDGRTLIDLRDKRGRLVVSANERTPKRVGAWTVRATCRSGAFSAPQDSWGIQVQMARPKSEARRPLTSTVASDFRKSPITNRVDSWASPGTNLFPDNMKLCRGEWIAAPAATPTPSPTPSPVVSSTSSDGGPCPDDHARAGSKTNACTWPAQASTTQEQTSTNCSTGSRRVWCAQGFVIARVEHDCVANPGTVIDEVGLNLTNPREGTAFCRVCGRNFTYSGETHGYYNPWVACVRDWNEPGQ